MEGILLVIIGFGWSLFKIISEACITPAPKGTNYRQATIDLSKGVSAKTVDRRISNGYYVKK